MSGSTTCIWRTNSLPIVEVIRKDIVTAAKRTIRDGAQCISINFQHSEEKFLNLDVFLNEKKKYDGVLLAYKSLSGKSVRVTCWDPQNSPGRWSKNSWFKNVFVLSDIVQVQEHIDMKSACKICGIADGLLDYSSGKNNDWFHYRCKFSKIIQKN